MKARIAQLIFGSLLLLLPAAAACADTQNFTIPSFTADYYLSKDAQNISHLRVHEVIVAEFPQFDQNHGILRAIPESYENHSVDLKIESVKDAAGSPWNYTTSVDNDNRVLKIGDAGRFVHGRQTYVIDYTMDNVTVKSPNGYDGNFWDVNGDQWQQVFGSVVARVHLEGDLPAQLQPEHTQCFTGARGSTASDCAFKKLDSATYEFAAARPLQPGETLTYELGFQPGTFVAYTMPRGALVAMIAAIVFGGILPPLVALFLVIWYWRRYGRDPSGRGVIIAEYTPPQDLSVLASSAIIKEGYQPKAISAQVIDLAVRGYLKIYETKEKVLFIDKSAYEIELVRDPADLRPEEASVIHMLFTPVASASDVIKELMLLKAAKAAAGSQASSGAPQNSGTGPAVGARVNLKDLDKKLYQQAKELGESVDKQLADSGYFRTTPEKAKLPFYIVGGILTFAGFFGFPFTLGVFIAGLIVLGSAHFMPARTTQGVERREYLLGLKEFITVAEADRIKMMQSPHGELTEKVDVNDKTQLVKVYERLLPFAMLFGIEKDWAKEFASLYQQPPDWYQGTSAFNAGYFAGSISSFATASSSSFSPPSSSGGGGSAGGGGGGGGGGGW